MKLLRDDQSGKSTGLMRRARTLVKLVSIAIVLTASPVSGDEGEARPAPVAAQLSEEAGARQVVAYQTTIGPSRAGVPVDAMAERTKRAYRHVFLAFGVAWLLILVYVVTLGSRFARIERDLARWGPPRQ